MQVAAIIANVLFLALARVDASGRFAISPELDPVSHKKFFKKDYPNDLRPKVHDHFSHPFPTVQEDKTYDSDYVKDENDDGGEWKAQDDYDKARLKLAKEKQDLKDAIAKEQKEEADLEETIKKRRRLRRQQKKLRRKLTHPAAQQETRPRLLMAPLEMSSKALTTLTKRLRISRIARNN